MNGSRRQPEERAAELLCSGGRPGQEPGAPLAYRDDIDMVVGVLGAAGRGTSQLTAALLEPPPAPDGAGTGVAVECGVPVEYRGGAPRGRCWRDAGGQVCSRQQARRLEVTLPSPVLEDMRVLDLPGMGGAPIPDGALDYRDEATLRMAADCGGLLFVAHAMLPLGPVELMALQRLSADVPAVLFALTGIEVQPRWREVLEFNRRTVADWVPRLAGSSWFPVAPRLGSVASPEASGAEWPDHSGMELLRSGLHTEIAGHARRLAAVSRRNRLRTALWDEHQRCGKRIAELQQQCAEPGHASTEHEPDALHRELRAVLQRIRLHAQWLVTEEFDSLHAQLRPVADSGTRQATRRLPQQLDEGAQLAVAAIWSRLSERITADTSAVFGSLLGPAACYQLAAGMHPVQRDAQPPAARAPSQLGPSQRGARLLAGLTGGAGVGRLALLPGAALPAVFGAAALPATVAAAAAAALLGGAVVMSSHAAVARRGELRQELDRALRTARLRVEHRIADWLIEVEQQLLAAAAQLERNRQRRTLDERDAPGSGPGDRLRELQRRQAHLADAAAELASAPEEQGVPHGRT